MLDIIPYHHTHDEDIQTMMKEIAREFVIPITNPYKSKTEIVPDKYWIAMVDHQFAGTLAIHKMDNTKAKLKNIFVKKTYRGKPLGVAQGLLEHSLSWARTQYVERIYLSTMVQFKAAQKFYSRNGFQKISKEVLPDTFIRNPIDDIYFQLNLH